MFLRTRRSTAEAMHSEHRLKFDRKIENFIRTKYESKRWVMDGPMPDPATLDAEGDDDVVSKKDLPRKNHGLLSDTSL